MPWSHSQTVSHQHRHSAARVRNQIFPFPGTSSIRLLEGGLLLWTGELILSGCFSELMWTFPDMADKRAAVETVQLLPSENSLKWREGDNSSGRTGCSTRICMLVKFKLLYTNAVQVEVDENKLVEELMLPLSIQLYSQQPATLLDITQPKQLIPERCAQQVNVLISVKCFAHMFLNTHSWYHSMSAHPEEAVSYRCQYPPADPSPSPQTQHPHGTGGLSPRTKDLGG